MLTKKRRFSNVLIITFLALLLFTTTWISTGYASDEPVHTIWNFSNLISASQQSAFNIRGLGRVIFPAGAMPTAAMVNARVDLIRSGEDAALYFSFSPHMNFNVPVQIFLSARGVNLDFGDNYTLYYYNESMQMWERMAGGAYQLGASSIIRFDLDHFSRYAFVKNEIDPGIFDPLAP